MFQCILCQYDSYTLSFCIPKYAIKSATSLMNQIMHHIESQGIICETQFGFRQNHSCETQLLLIVDDFARAMDRNIQVDVGILDMSKAFDKVPHERLALKLHHYGIRGNVLTWLNHFLEIDLNRW